MPTPEPNWHFAFGAIGVGTIISTLLQIWNTWRLERTRDSNSTAIEHLKADLGKISALGKTAEERRALIAAEVLVALLRMLDALEGATSLAVFATEEVPADLPESARRKEEGRREARARQKSVKPYEEDFRRAWHLAEAMLPDAVHELFGRMNKFKIEVNVAQVMHAGDPDRSQVYGFFQKGFGEQPQSRLAEFRAEAKSLLRPIAQIARV